MDSANIFIENEKNEGEEERREKKESSKKHVHIKHLLYIARCRMCIVRSLHNFIFHKEKKVISSNSGFDLFP